MCIRDFSEFFYLPGSSVEMRDYNQSDFRVESKCPFQCSRIHVPGLIFRVDEDCFAALISHGIHCGIKGHVRAENLLSLQHTMPHFGLTV